MKKHAQKWVNFDGFSKFIFIRMFTHVKFLLAELLQVIFGMLQQKDLFLLSVLPTESVPKDNMF